MKTFRYFQRALLGGVLASATPTFATMAGPASPSVCINAVSSGTAAWNFPERAVASDNLRAAKSIDHEVTQFLVCNGFGFSLPDASVITGIVVENEVSVGGADESIQDSAQRLVRGAHVGTADRAHPATWSQGDSRISHGSPSDLWGACWCAYPVGTNCPDPACGNVNNPDFGTALAAAHTTGNGGTARVDHVQVSIYYVQATPTSTPTITQTSTPTWTPTITTTPSPSFASCPASPADGCTPSGRARIRISSNSSPVARQLKWSWERGSVGLAEFGDPSNGTSYALCLYDDEELMAEMRVSSADACGRLGCWQASSGPGFGYRNRGTNTNGVAELRLRAGSGSASIRLKARRANLSLPMPIRKGRVLTAQLVKNPGSGLECWSTRFEQPASQNSLDNFKDRVPD